ncbi:endonuclease/exonuclease/phosphatase family protein [Haloferula sp. A504]|uniref:endonuclease/exonuclease/phosphatase family protein n=1 Tax=Haloferula sp. A504 TaxID=3373601 RepID=UPI0037C04DE6
MMLPAFRWIVAPGILGAFVLALPSCDRHEELTAWEGEPVVAEASPPAAEESSVTDPAPDAEAPEDRNTERAKQGSTDTLRFIAYNVENWLTMDRYIDGKRINGKPKPDSEKEAVVSIIARHRPDVLGLCEVGTPADLADLQDRLKAAGVDLPHAHHTGGFDDTRRLAMLSRHPFANVELHENLEYQLEGRTFGMGRGILDVTVDSPVGDIRFLGAHLKSKREIPEADQEMMRRAEAHLLREQATRILTADPTTALIVYGDLNDTRNSSAVRTVRGPRSGPLKLGMAWLKDERGQTWTHFWDFQDVYSRFDYVLFSEALTERALWDECKLLDDPEWADASDHRATLFVIE